MVCSEQREPHCAVEAWNGIRASTNTGVEEQMMLRTIVSLATLAVVGAGILLPASDAAAHAGYDRSAPLRDEVLSDPPSRADVWFTQEVFKREGLNFIRVFDEAGMQVSDEDGIVDDDDRAHMYAELTPALPAGRYIVRWMTTSDLDGDREEGAFCFYVNVQPTAAQQAECAEFDEAGAEVSPTPTEAATPTPAADTTPTAEVTSTEEAPDATQTPAETAGNSDDDDDTSIAIIIIGVIIGAAVLVAVIAGVAAWMRRTMN